ncbi:hypothetical protein BDV95DRAFT_501226 [Massariosphaeria phaeospora]|uniref:DUF7703 domain-containing protein n=1 Tax=Massariosphaeria phaeospora TaxID=100035 RepID=A0A7C8I365_9PLEO|nr:hypothetical protein BDV95DRAFT_501226 [Massariosphaeria phaeospora]
MGTQYQVPYVNALVIASFFAVTWYNVAELTVLIHTFFKRHAGFYYYSLQVANWGIFLHALGTFLKIFRINEHYSSHTVLNTVIAWTGWVGMVTGQSIVLYCRLHLVVQAPWVRWILVMIIVNGVVLHTSTGALTFLTNSAKNPEPYLGPYSVIERIQITIFFLQEVVLSGIYIWKTAVMLRAEGPIFNKHKNARGSKGRKVLTHTIVMSFIIICLDITLIGLEFSGLYDIQTAYKGAVYSVKLKIEFTILNQLMVLVKGRLRESTFTSVHTGLESQAANQQRTGTQLGNSAGAYARMHDSVAGNKISAIKLKELRDTQVLKTTTTTVEVESMDSGRAKELRRSSSSEIHIVDYDRN